MEDIGDAVYFQGSLTVAIFRVSEHGCSLVLRLLQIGGQVIEEEKVKDEYFPVSRQGNIFAVSGKFVFQFNFKESPVCRLNLCVVLAIEFIVEYVINGAEKCFNLETRGTPFFHIGILVTQMSGRIGIHVMVYYLPQLSQPLSAILQQFLLLFLGDYISPKPIHFTNSLLFIQIDCILFVSTWIALQTPPKLFVLLFHQLLSGKLINQAQTDNIVLLGGLLHLIYVLYTLINVPQRSSYYHLALARDEFQKKVDRSVRLKFEQSYALELRGAFEYAIAPYEQITQHSSTPYYLIFILYSDSFTVCPYFLEQECAQIVFSLHVQV